MPQPEASTTICPWRRQLTIAEAGEKRDDGRKTAGI
jgi:hypothetical protein